jgi:hypothetical protein
MCKPVPRRTRLSTVKDSTWIDASLQQEHGEAVAEFSQ